MIKVLYLLDTLNVGGAETSTLEIVRRFRRTRAVVCHLFKESPLKPSFEQADIKTISLNMPSKRAYIQAFRKLAEILRFEQPDILMLTGFYSGFIGRVCGKLYRIPTVDAFTNETYTKTHYASVPKRYRFKLRIAQILERITLKWTAIIIANSRAVAELNSASLKISSQKISVIYRGRNPEDFRPISKRQKDEIRKSLFVDSISPVILAVSRLILRKGLSDLVTAMAMIRRLAPDVQLLIAGNGHYRDHLEKQIQGYGLQSNIRLLGQRNDIPRLLQIADLFVFPSLFEGQPGAVIEAMFSALPIIASDIPVHREMLERTRSGSLVSVNRPDLLAKEIIHLINNKDMAGEMGRRARQTAFDYFNIDKIAAQHEELYNAMNNRSCKGM